MFDRFVKAPKKDAASNAAKNGGVSNAVKQDAASNAVKQDAASNAVKNGDESNAVENGGASNVVTKDAAINAVKSDGVAHGSLAEAKSEQRLTTLKIPRAKRDLVGLDQSTNGHPPANRVFDREQTDALFKKGFEALKEDPARTRREREAAKAWVSTKPSTLTSAPFKGVESKPTSVSQEDRRPKRLPAPEKFRSRPIQTAALTTVTIQSDDAEGLQAEKAPLLERTEPSKESPIVPQVPQNREGTAKAPGQSTPPALPGWELKTLETGRWQYSKDKDRLTFDGQRVKGTTGSEHEVDAMFAIARAKNWQHMAFNGDDAFKLKVMETAVKNNWRVETQSPKDAKMYENLRRAHELAQSRGKSLPNPSESQQNRREALVDQSKVSERQGQRTAGSFQLGAQRKLVDEVRKKEHVR